LNEMGNFGWLLDEMTCWWDRFILNLICRILCEVLMSMVPKLYSLDGISAKPMLQV